MGVMLSVLVTCVGVVELITFCHKISRHLTNPPRRGDLTVVSDRYVQELGSIRKRIAEDLKKYQETPPTLCLNHHEDIDIEFSKNLQNSRSPSPRRFLVTEKSDIEKNGNSPRKFLVSEEPDGGLKKSKSHDSIPEFLIQQEQNFEKSSHKPRYVLNEKPNDSSSSPIPRQFIVSEESLNTIVFEDVDFEVPETSISRDKSPSPFLTIVAPQAPRNSICNEIEEEPPRKYIPPHHSEKVDVILESKNYNTTEYWTNKVLVVPSKISRSRSGSGERDDIKDTSNNENLMKYDEKYLNDLDGVSKAKAIKKFGTSRKSLKRKNADQKQNSLSQDTLDTTTVLKHAAEELEKVSIGEETSQATTSKVLDPKSGEPFWVKH